MMIDRTCQLRCRTGRTVVRRNGFTLTEILVVIGIIVLMLALAVPAFNIMRGSRSIEGAENQLSAMLARARTEALGNQNTGGVFFFVDPRTPDRVSCAAVEQVQISPAAMLQNNGTRDIYLDLVPERDFLVLPPGVGLQVINDFATVPDTGARKDDAYIGYNKFVSFNGGSPIQTKVGYGGVILFDSAGRLLSESYGFRIRQEGTNGNLAAPSAMGNLLFYVNDPTSPINNTVMGMTTAFVEPGTAQIPDPEEYPRSQFGLVLFDQPSFQNAGGADDDLILGQTPQATYLNSKEAAEETWIDKNATPLLINRYNGTLTRGGT